MVSLADLKSIFTVSSRSSRAELSWLAKARDDITGGEAWFLNEFSQLF